MILKNIIMGIVVGLLMYSCQISLTEVDNRNAPKFVPDVEGTTKYGGKLG